MTHDVIFEIFESLDIDEIITVKINLPARHFCENWIISDVRLEDEGLYVQYFPFQRAEVQLAFIPWYRMTNNGITAVKRA